MLKVVDVPNLVVICLQFCIFKGFFSTQLHKVGQNFMLWFAYNFVFLKGSFQQRNSEGNLLHSCDLLTILYF